MSTLYNVSTDLKEAQAMVENLSTYLRGEQLYGNTGGGFFSTMPSLTVGALLMRLHRLNDLRASMNKNQQEILDKVTAEWSEVRESWRSHYEQKVVQEVTSRVTSMASFFRECADSRQACYNNYLPEIQKRTIIEELLNEMDELDIEADEIQEQVAAADKELRALMQANGFQWDAQLQDVYPQETYWWLYQSPPNPTE